MSVDSAYFIEQYIQDGETRYTFKYESIGAAAIQVYSVLIADTTQRTLLINEINYTLELERAEAPTYKGGTIVLYVPLSADSFLQIERKTPIISNFLAVSGEPFEPLQYEFVMDRICFIQQEIEGSACDCRTPAIAPGPPSGVACKVFTCDAYSTWSIANYEAGNGWYWPAGNPPGFGELRGYGTTPDLPIINAGQNGYDFGGTLFLEGCDEAGWTAQPEPGGSGLQGSRLSLEDNMVGPPGLSLSMLYKEFDIGPTNGSIIPWHLQVDYDYVPATFQQFLAAIHTTISDDGTSIQVYDNTGGTNPSGVPLEWTVSGFDLHDGNPHTIGIGWSIPATAIATKYEGFDIYWVSFPLSLYVDGARYDHDFVVDSFAGNDRGATVPLVYKEPIGPEIASDFAVLQFAHVIAEPLPQPSDPGGAAEAYSRNFIGYVDPNPNCVPPPEPEPEPPPTTDPDFNTVQALLHFDENSSGGFWAEVSGKSTWSNFGLIVSSDSAVYGPNGLGAAGFDEYMRTLDIAEPLSSDVTYECYPINCSIQTSDTVLMDGRLGDTGPDTENEPYLYCAANTGNLIFSIKGNTIVSTTNIRDGGSHHIAAVKSSDLWTLYINGVSEGGTYLGSGDTIYGSRHLAFTKSGTGTRIWDGGVDELRISHIARYTTNFTPPTTPFPDSA